MNYLEQAQLAQIFKALADENRLRVLFLLQDGEKCACKLLEALQIGQSTLSHHMKILCACGLVNCRKEGKWAHYCLHAEGAARPAQWLQNMMEVKKTEGSGR